ncbi:unnamed protein product [Prunus armeniaca]
MKAVAENIGLRSLQDDFGEVCQLTLVKSKKKSKFAFLYLKVGTFVYILCIRPLLGTIHLILFDNLQGPLTAVEGAHVF